MFRDSAINIEKFRVKFKFLDEKLKSKVEVQLNSEYHQQLKAYINRLYIQTCENENFSNENFLDIKDAEMSNLNRLQKLKNGSNYKKDKHKLKDKNQDWG